MGTSYFELAGGSTGLKHLADAFYRRVFSDPLLAPLFRDPTEDHAGRMAMWLGEFLGGPPEHTRQRGGLSRQFEAHQHLDITDVHRQRWIDHMMAACRDVNLAREVMDFLAPHIRRGAENVARRSEPGMESPVLQPVKPGAE